MARIEKSIEIKAPPEKVWEMLALDRHPEWMGYKSVQYTSEVRTPEDKYRVGASVHIIGPEDGFWADLVITESLENEKITCRGNEKIRVLGNTTIILTYSLKPTEAGTEITSVVDYEMSSILGKILAKLASGSMEKEVGRALEKLKSILEK